MDITGGGNKIPGFLNEQWSEGGEAEFTATFAAIGRKRAIERRMGLVSQGFFGSILLVLPIATISADYIRYAAAAGICFVWGVLYVLTKRSLDAATEAERKTNFVHATKHKVTDLGPPDEGDPKPLVTDATAKILEGAVATK